MEERNTAPRGKGKSRVHWVAAGVFALAIVLGLLFMLLQRARWYYHDLVEFVPKDVDVLVRVERLGQMWDSWVRDTRVSAFINSTVFEEEVKRIPLIARVLHRINRVNTSLMTETGVNLGDKTTLNALFGSDFVIAARTHGKRVREFIIITKVDPLAILAAEITGRLGTRRRTVRHESGEEFNLSIMGSLLMMSNSSHLLEQSLALVEGSTSGTLAEDPAFIRLQQGLTRDASPRLYAFARFSRIVENWFPETQAGIDARSEFLNYTRFFTMWPTESIEDIAAAVSYDGDFRMNSIATLRQPLSPSDQKQLSMRPGPFKLAGSLSPGTTFVNACHMDFSNAWQALKAAQPPTVQAHFPAEIKSLEEFLGGRDFHNDILPSIGPEFATVIAEQDFGKWGVTPEFPLPAFAIYVGVSKPEELARDWEKAVAKFLEDVRRSQWEAEKEAARREGKPEPTQPPPPLYVRKSEQYRGANIHFFEFDVEKSDFDRALVPAYVFTDDHFIFSTSLFHIKEVLDARARLAQEGDIISKSLAGAVLADTHNQVRVIDFAKAIDILDSNVRTIAETRAGWRLREQCRRLAVEEIRKSYTSEVCAGILKEKMESLRNRQPEEPEERIRKYAEELLELQIEEDIRIAEQRKFEELAVLPAHQANVEKEIEVCKRYLAELRSCLGALVMTMNTEVEGEGESSLGILRIMARLILSKSPVVKEEVSLR